MAEKMTLIVFSGDMDKALAAFNLAIGGASIGHGSQHVLHLLGTERHQEERGPDQEQGHHEEDAQLHEPGRGQEAGPVQVPHVRDGEVDDGQADEGRQIPIGAGTDDHGPSVGGEVHRLHHLHGHDGARERKLSSRRWTATPVWPPTWPTPRTAGSTCSSEEAPT